jgi:hypothetical protein
MSEKPSYPPHARSFTGGFRTTAPMQGQPSRWAVIRNPSQQGTSAFIVAIEGSHRILLSTSTEDLGQFSDIL